MTKRLELSAEYLRDAYLTRGLKLSEVAKAQGCSVDAVYKAMCRHGIERRPQGNKGPDGFTQEDVARLCAAGKSTGEIAAELGSTYETIRHRLRKWELTPGRRRRRSRRPA